MVALFDKNNLYSAAHGFDYMNGHRIDAINNKESDEYASLHDLVTALILYDEILYLPDSKGGFFYDETFPYYFDINFFDNLPITKADVDPLYIRDIISYTKNTFPTIKYVEGMRKKLGPSMYLHYKYEIGSLEYLFISNYLGATYFPCPNRHEFLNNHLLLDDYKINPGEEIIHYIDRNVLEFYEELNRRIGKSYINFQMPLLLDYVYHMSRNKKELLQTALDIRKTKEVVNFRQWINSINEAIINGNWVEYNNSLDIVAGIINDIRKINGVPSGSCEVTLSWPPSISFPINIKHKQSRKAKLGSIFVGALASYGMTGRPSPFNKF